MRRSVRPVTLACRGQSEIVDIPGWFREKCDEGMRESDHALTRMKVRHQGAPTPE